MLRHAFALATSACLALASSSSAFADPAAYRLGDLTITEVFARASVIDTGAAYLSVANAGAGDDLLIAAATPMAAVVELHEMAMDGDAMIMRPLDGGIVVPAGGSVTLAPGGLHVMLFGLTGHLVEGETLPLTLQFEQAGEILLEIPIRAMAAGAPGMDHQQHGN